MSTFSFSLRNPVSANPYPVYRRRRDPNKPWKLKAKARRSLVNRITGRFTFYLTVVALLGLAALSYMPRLMVDNINHTGRNTEIGCMALNMWHEGARVGSGFKTDEPYEGLLAIGITVQNRLELGFRQANLTRPQSLCDVVWSPAQFSWTLWDDSRIFSIAEKDKPAFNRVFQAAADVLANNEQAQAVRAIVKDADHYYNPRVVSPSWANRMTDFGMVGNHRFMADSNRYSAARSALLQKHGLLAPTYDSNSLGQLAML